MDAPDNVKAQSIAAYRLAARLLTTLALSRTQTMPVLMAATWGVFNGASARMQSTIIESLEITSRAMRGRLNDRGATKEGR